MSMRRFLCLLALLPLVAHSADEVTLRSGERRTPLLELFSSEGCSSCPPAEHWLRELDQAPGLWRDFVPVSWHVDYWDYLGWRDRFSSPLSTERQRNYARIWSSAQIYTPCLVFDGRERRMGDVPKAGNQRVGILTAQLTGTDAAVRFQPITAPTAPREVWLAVLSGPESTAVKAGENSGRTLSHGFVVLRTSHARMTSSDGAFAARLSRPAVESARAVALWVALAGNPAAEQSVGSWLAKR